MTTEDKIKLRQDAQSKLKDLFGSECVMTDFKADRYVIEIDVDIAGMPFHCYSHNSLNNAIDALIQEYRTYMSYPRETRQMRRFPEVSFELL